MLLRYERMCVRFHVLESVIKEIIFKTILYEHEFVQKKINSKIKSQILSDESFNRTETGFMVV